MAKTFATRRMKIDFRHSIALIEGKPIAIRIPEGLEIAEFELDPLALRLNRMKPAGDVDVVKLADILFNGRKA